jgi:hypothetical protein
MVEEPDHVDHVSSQEPGGGHTALALRREVIERAPPSHSLPPLSFLQVFKFAVYLGVPIALTAFAVYSPGNLQSIINNVRCGRQFTAAR